MKTKRFLCCISVFLITLMLWVLPASAQEVPENLQGAAETLREGIKNWENFITVTFTVGLDSFDGTTASANDLADRILDLALAHTGVPDEGDYLRFNIGYMEPNAVNFTKQADGWQFSVTYYIVYWTTAEQEAAVDAEIENLVQQLELRSDMTDYQKVSAIYNYICGNVTYDYDRLNDNSYGLKFTTYAAAVDKTAVCQGYSTLFYRLALEAGVDNRIVTGIAYGDDGSEEHAWNAVNLDGKYYYLDSTWDAETYIYYYFLKCADGMMNHQLDAEFITEKFLTAYPPAMENYVHPDQTTNEADFEYQIINDAAVIFKYNGTDRDVVVPATLGGYPVHTVASNAFFFNDYIVSLTFSEGIQFLETEAILECVNLKSIHLPSTVNFTASNVPDFLCRVICGPSLCPSVETITVAEGNPHLVVVDNVLYNKEMTILRYFPASDPREYFEIPEGVQSVGAGAFRYNRNLKEVKLSDSVLRVQMLAFDHDSQLEKFHISNSCHFIDQYNFSGTALKSIHIPASVKTLFAGTFGIDSILETITVDPGNPVYYVEDGVLYGRYSEGCNVDDCHMPGNWLVKYPEGREETTFTVPDGIVGIEQHAFDCGANLQEIILPDSLEILYNGAFWGCSKLTKIELPNSLKKIYDSVFYECNELVELVIPANVKLLGYNIIESRHNLENLVFLGEAPPSMVDQTFPWNPIDVYYPTGNAKWESAKQKYSHDNAVRWIEACETHQFADKTRAATCTLTGYTGRECIVCGLVEVTGELIPATGHDLVLDHVTAPGCEWLGYRHYRCNICQEYILEDYGSRTGHNIGADGFCTQCALSFESVKTGNPLYRCSICQELVSISEFIYENVTCVNCAWNGPQTSTNVSDDIYSDGVTYVPNSGGGQDTQDTQLLYMVVIVAVVVMFLVVAVLMLLLRKKN